jgi:hypothetical protein
MSSLLHGIVHVVPNNPRGPQAPIRKHRVGPDIDVDITARKTILLVEPPTVLKNLDPVANLHEGVLQQ